MDTVQYLENDWNNRNKIRTPQGTHWLTVPIDRNKTKSNSLNNIIIVGYDRPDAKDFWQDIHWKTIVSNYKKSPFFHIYEEELYDMYQNIIWERLVDICWHQFVLVKKWLGLDAIKVVRMSEMKFNGNKDKLVLDHCLKLNGDAVVFGMHGKDYVDISIFEKENIDLYFQNYDHPVYKQRFGGFEPNVSVLDLLLNHGSESINILMNKNKTKQQLLAGDDWVKPLQIK